MLLRVSVQNHPGGDSVAIGVSSLSVLLLGVSVQNHPGGDSVAIGV